VEHIVGPGEVELTDTDQRMRAILASPGRDATEPLDANPGVATIRGHIFRSAEAAKGHKDPALTARGLEMALDRTRRERRSPTAGTFPIEEAVDQSQCAREKAYL
jgi:hypothetical protein